MSIKDNLEKIKSDIKSLTDKPVKIVGVTKYSGIPQIIEAINAGLDIIGENRVGEAMNKFPNLPCVEKHMIGHLQSNKVKDAVRFFDCIQSVDSLKLAKEISRRTTKTMPVMLQVNVSLEKQKFGVGVEQVESFFDQVKRFENLEVIGLMTIAPHEKSELTRPVFKTLKQINNRLELPFLSMGMSNDYKIAVEEGSNMVRIGSAIFR